MNEICLLSKNEWNCSTSTGKGKGGKDDMSTPIFRYVGLTTGLRGDCHAREFEINHIMFLGNQITIYDEDDNATYNYRILRIEGTVNNKSSNEIEHKTTSNLFVVKKCYENNVAQNWAEERREVKVA